MLRHRAYCWLAACLVLVSLPARFFRLKDSLWLDEAWVANSVLEPSLGEMFFTDAWAQSTPPLFLLLERGMIAVFGVSEVIFRAVPLAASLGGTLLCAVALRRWLSARAALCAPTLLCGNYYVVKYGQQVKQYGTDFFVAALMLWLTGRYLADRSIRNYWLLLAVGTIALFLSYPGAFWLPTLVAASALPGAAKTDGGAGSKGLDRGRLLAGVTIPGLALISLYSVFVRPNRTEALIAHWQSSYLDIVHPLTSMLRLIQTAGKTFAGVGGMLSTIAGVAVLALAGSAAVRAIQRARRDGPGARRSLMLSLAGILPLLSCLGAGDLHLYPVLEYPRMLLFSLPSLVLLLGYGVEALLAWSRRSAVRAAVRMAPVFSVCLVAVLATQFVHFRFPRPAEENRPALQYISQHFGPSDLLFIHPGMFEQFKYYGRMLGFRPDRRYVGNVHWPCCATGDRLEASHPEAGDLAADLLEAARRARGDGLWLFLPAGTEGHWTAELRPQFDAIPRVLAGADCRREDRRLIGQTLVEHYSCR